MKIRASLSYDETPFCCLKIRHETWFPVRLGSCKSKRSQDLVSCEVEAKFVSSENPTSIGNLKARPCFLISTILTTHIANGTAMYAFRVGYQVSYAFLAWSACRWSIFLFSCDLQIIHHPYTLTTSGRPFQREKSDVKKHLGHFADCSIS